MGKSNRLRMSDVREVFHIVIEAIELGNDPVAWRQRMLERMCKLIDAEFGLAFLIPMEFDPKNLKPPLLVHSPMPQKQERVLQKYFRLPDVVDDPLTQKIQKLAHKPVTRLRRQLVDDKTWYGSNHFKTHRVDLGTDDVIHAHDPLPQYKAMAVLGFTPLMGDKPFELRDARVVDLLRSELRRRWESAPASGRPIDLSPRLGQLLNHLKGTKSEKQIAKYMGLSLNTTHNYVKEVYKRLDVSSRAELLQRASAVASVSLPKLGWGDA